VRQRAKFLRVTTGGAGLTLLIKNDEMDPACNTCREGENCLQNFDCETHRDTDNVRSEI